MQPSDGRRRSIFRRQPLPQGAAVPCHSSSAIHPLRSVRRCLKSIQAITHTDHEAYSISISAGAGPLRVRRRMHSVQPLDIQERIDSKSPQLVRYRPRSASSQHPRSTHTVRQCLYISSRSPPGRRPQTYSIAYIPFDAFADVITMHPFISDKSDQWYAIAPREGGGMQFAASSSHRPLS